MIFRKPAQVFMKIEEGEYMSEIARKTKKHVNRIFDMIKTLENLKLIKKVRDGKTKRIILTKKGKKVKELLIKCNNLIWKS